MMGSERFQIRIRPNADSTSSRPTDASGCDDSGKPCGMLVLPKSGLIGHCAGTYSRQYLAQRNVLTSTEQVHT
jgi:hypothetical protein